MSGIARIRSLAKQEEDISRKYVKVLEPNLKRGLERMERSKNSDKNSVYLADLLEELDGKRGMAKLKELEIRNNEEIKQGISTYSSLVRQCTSVSELDSIRNKIKKSVFSQDRFLANVLMQMYSKLGSLDSARASFETISKKNVYSYNILFNAYIQHGKDKEAIRLFRQMRREWIEPDLYSISGLIGAYGRIGKIEKARILFDGLSPNEDVVSWTSMISVYAQTGKSAEAIHLYWRMNQEGVEPNMVTYSSLLDGCESIKEGRAIHERALARKPQLDVVLVTSLVIMYSKCGSLEEARKVFDTMQKKNVVTWTAMIGAYASSGNPKEALRLYKSMESRNVCPNTVTFANALTACANLGDLTEGQAIHNHILKGTYNVDNVLKSALLHMYVKCGGVHDGGINKAKEVFETMETKDVGIWNVMISAYALNRQMQKAFEIYERMKAESIEPNSITHLSLLGGCLTHGDLEIGKIIQTHVYAQNPQPSMEEESALVSMYAKCGSLDEATKIFEKMRERDVVSWNGMISGHAQHNRGDQALKMYMEMLLEGILPDSITFTCVLLVCSQAGLQATGRQHFMSIKSEYGMAADTKHYQCMIDLLARAGRLSESEELLMSMPFESDAVAWGTLLNGCTLHADVERAARAADKTFELNPSDASPYTLLSNMYSSTGRFKDVEKLRKMMQIKGID